MDLFLVYRVLQTFSLCVLALYLTYVYWKRRRFVNCVNQLPTRKLKFYCIFGHITERFFYKAIRKHKRPASDHVYDFMKLCGHNHIFSKYNICMLWQMHMPFITVYKADSVETILNHSTEIKKAWFYELLHPWLGTGLLTSHDDKWRRKRKLLTPAFHFNILTDFLTVFNKQSKVLLTVLEKHTEEEFIDIVPVLAKCSLDIICESVMGHKLHTQTQPTSPYVTAVTELTAGFFKRMQSPWLWNDFIFKMTPFGKKFYENVKLVHDFTNKLISERKKMKLEMRNSPMTPPEGTEKEDDIIKHRKKRALMDLLLEEQIENNSLTEEEIREEIDTFTFEAHDTTAISMSWSLYLIGLHPWVQERIHEELDVIFDQDVGREATTEDLKDMKYLECVIKEALRLYPSVPAFGRKMRSDLEFQGRLVPEGSTLLVDAYVLHRDPEVFPIPEKFDPERFTPENSAGRHPFAYVPFSGGSRNCIGQRFAIMEEKTVLSFILRKYKVRSLDPRDMVHPVAEAVLRPEKGLRLQIRRRDQDFDFKTVYYFP